MLGHSHALSGIVAAAAIGEFALHLPDPRLVALAGFTAGMALLPDLDKCGSCPARCLGFLSEGVAWFIGKVSRGHRHLTHTIIGIAIFTALAWASCLFRHDWGGRIGLGLLITLSVAGGLEALHITRGTLADLAGVAVAAGVVMLGFGLTLIPLAVAIGVSTHICGDMLTDSGCMLLYPFSKHRFHLLPGPLQFTTGTDPELYGVDPVLTGLLLVLGGWAVDPGFIVTTWAALSSRI
jgi:membrane-bound metal-dependent hydrolase YbcI (DUF457 family)